MIDFSKDFEDFCKWCNIDPAKDEKTRTDELSWCARRYVESTLKDMVKQINSNYHTDLNLIEECGDCGVYFEWR